MCYTIEKQSKRKIGYKLARKVRKGVYGSAFGELVYHDDQTFKERSNRWSWNGRTAAFIKLSDAKKSTYFYDVLLKVEISDDVCEGIFEKRPIISGKRLVKILKVYDISNQNFKSIRY